MKLTDDWLLEHAPIKRCNWQMALYAAHLATGSTLACRAIKGGTITKYLLDIARFLARFSDRDPRRESPTDHKLADCLNAVIAEVKRWELMPIRREPFTPIMWKHMDAVMTAHPDLHGPDSILAAMVDWFGSGLYGGWRLTEWGQPAGNADVTTPHLDFKGETRAFCLPDLEFRLDGNRRISQQHAYAGKADRIERIHVTFRTQKNGDNGEVRVFTRNKANTRLCFVKCVFSLFQRFVRLMGWNTTAPLGIARGATGVISSITATDIEREMRAAAAVVYDLDPVKHKYALSKWSAHSLRVGACVILHSQRFSATQIQFLLRWRSMAFMMYLRNLAFLAGQQNEAVADTATMPNFI